MSLAPGAVRGAPRYEQVARRLAEEISDGVFAPGEYLPGETAIGQRFGVSRHTVREALRRLQSLGLVASQQGKGTTVLAREPTGLYQQQFSSIDDLLQYADKTRLVDVSQHTLEIDPELAVTIGCTAGQRFVKTEALRLTGTTQTAQPLAWNTIYIADIYAGAAAEIGKYRGFIGKLIEERYGERIIELRQEVRAIALADHEARRLDASPGSPALEMQRWYIGQDGKPFQYVIAVHPADRYTISTRVQTAAR
ncbi:MAG: GntR family transcriptional regulator [Alphaproteobacteria bacterium]